MTDSDHERRPGSVPRQLPPATRRFVGRSAELERLKGMIQAVPRGAVVIAVINGTPGVGKTELALQWAHEVKDRFPDGQLYVNLRGYGPEELLTAGDALGGFLRALGVAAPDVPVETADRAALFRTSVAGRRVLVVLDNARTEEQIRPLLPGEAGCFVLTTTRDSMSGLVVRDGAERIGLGLLSKEHSLLLLRDLIGPRFDEEPEAAEKLVEYCARLPLALRIAAETAVSEPDAELAELVADLTDERGRLDVLAAGDDAHTAVRAVFSWSYRHLTPSAARVFRLVGLHPGTEFGLEAAAALSGQHPTDAKRLLQHLSRAHLVETAGKGRYRMHDLLRAYAAELVVADEEESAVHRLLDHYLHTACSAALRMNPHRPQLTLAAAVAGSSARSFTTYQEAWLWFESEYAALVDVAAFAADHGWDSHAWQIPWTLTTFFNRRGYLDEYVSAQRIGLRAAERTGDPLGQSHCHRYLGNALALSGKHDEAVPHFERALMLFDELGDSFGKAFAYRSLSWVLELSGRYREALVNAELARDLQRELGNPAGEAHAWSSLAHIKAKLGDHQGALDAGNICRDLYRDVDRDGEATALEAIGTALSGLGRHGAAISAYVQAIAIFDELGDDYDAAKTLVNLGDAHDATGDDTGARAAWGRALLIFERLDHSDADSVRARLG
ncbi:ATP-binding protein [Amycolatopsis orientalis]|uniref:ATP-binding protein n=1 Tax=Amycolatopsis orientalis TaxID=31958 RepID=UPI00040CDE80|nr:tetratricopeptide repeat protein [Amycolatopsis orientalis]